MYLADAGSGAVTCSHERVGCCLPWLTHGHVSPEQIVNQDNGYRAEYAGEYGALARALLSSVPLWGGVACE